MLGDKGTVVWCIAVVRTGHRRGRVGPTQGPLERCRSVSTPASNEKRYTYLHPSCGSHDSVGATLVTTRRVERDRFGEGVDVVK